MYLADKMVALPNLNWSLILLKINGYGFYVRGWCY